MYLPEHSQDGHKWRLVAGLLAQDGYASVAISVLSALACSGDAIASQLLAGLLAQDGQLAQLRQRMRHGDVPATRQLAALASENGWEDELRELSSIDVYACCALARRLAARGHVEEALELVRPWADSQDLPAQVFLAALLARHGRTVELRERSARGDWECTMRLVEQLSVQGHPDQAAAHLRCAVAMRAAAVAANERCDGRLDPDHEGGSDDDR